MGQWEREEKQPSKREREIWVMCMALFGSGIEHRVEKGSPCCSWFAVKLKPGVGVDEREVHTAKVPTKMEKNEKSGFKMNDTFVI